MRWRTRMALAVVGAIAFTALSWVGWRLALPDPAVEQLQPGSVSPECEPLLAGVGLPVPPGTALTCIERNKFAGLWLSKPTALVTLSGDPTLDQMVVAHELGHAWFDFAGDLAPAEWCEARGLAQDGMLGDVSPCVEDAAQAVEWAVTGRDWQPYLDVLPLPEPTPEQGALIVQLLGEAIHSAGLMWELPPPCGSLMRLACV